MLRLRHLRLIATTADGPYGADLAFDSGLVVLRADNTTGKSTAIQAVVYALGLEPMLTARHVPPLPPAMTDRLLDPDGAEIPVLESSVMLEIENADAEVLTIRRWVKHREINPNLVTTWAGPVLSAPEGAYEPTDYFVRLPGAAQREAGFQHRLAEFLGWEVPTLVRTDGTEVPLYLELIFPLIIVEQKRGWGGIQAQMPPYGGIPEARKRAIEFLLGLAVYERIRERQELTQQLQQLGDEWRNAISIYEASLEGTGGVIEGLPRQLSLEWPPAARSYVAFAAEEGWVPSERYLSDLRMRQRALEDEEIPRVEATVDEVTRRLGETEEELALLSAQAVEVARDVRLEEGELFSLGRRLASLDEDLRRNQDARTLERLGSQNRFQVLDAECPTCHQELPPALFEVVSETVHPMTLEQNITFIQEQKQTFGVMRDEATRRLHAKRERLQALREIVSDKRREIRADRTTLTSRLDAPSVAAVRERLELNDRVQRMEELSQRFEGLLNRLGELAGQAQSISTRLDSLPREHLSEEDERRLRLLSQSLTEQLRDYDFSSFPVESIDISRETYLPNREGFDLSFDISASDLIRLIWAYLVGLLEVARAEDTNHPGLLIFDEPRQQEAAQVSFEALLQRVSRAGAAQQQVIFATSEPTDVLTATLASVPHQYLSFEGRILQRLSDGDRL